MQPVDGFYSSLTSKSIAFFKKKHFLTFSHLCNAINVYIGEVEHFLQQHKHLGCAKLLESCKHRRAEAFFGTESK